MNLVLILQVVLSVCFLGILIDYGMDMTKNHKGELYNGTAKKWGFALLVGILCNFTDTLGVGSFAPSSFLYKASGCFDDKTLPGNLNIGDTFPVIFEALIFTGSVDCDPTFLVAMCVAAMIGSFAMAEIVSKWDRNMIRIVMGVFLFLCGPILILKGFSLGPFAGVEPSQTGLILNADGVCIGLSGGKFWAAVIFNVLLGALMDVGFGLYAPCMAFCMILGVDTGACFPVFMGSCALLMPACSLVFIKNSIYDPIAVAGNLVGGILGVLIAWKVVTSMPTKAIIVVVSIVMVWTAYMMFRDAARDKKAAKNA